MQNNFTFVLLKKSQSNHARVTQLITPHGEVLTPCFMPVGTRAFVNHMTPSDLIATGSQLILGGNTYHMLLSPGMELIEAAGGMHPFMGWKKPMLTDSGGFQVFSLSKNKKLCLIDEKGAHFKHPHSGKIMHLTPQLSIESQKIIGADIIMAFDECTPENVDRARAEIALERTHRWLNESHEIHTASPSSVYGMRQALFGIIQGGSFRELRERSAHFIVQANLDGIALGGEVIGFNMEKTIEVIDWVRPLLPDNKPRYTMGVGMHPQDLINVVAQGIDLFDCVAPTRNARHGALYVGKPVRENGWVVFQSEEENARILIKKAKYAKDEHPLQQDCRCYTCQHFSRAYLHYLFKQKSALYAQLGCIHNIFVLNNLCAVLREIILEND